ncbi:MAG TPA: CHASE3 domain-containing protein, partial [Bryobacteraceae bacterium]|nr:CHASE3 domain-containing protein [Bryobacteraceae bacterium]
PVAMLFAVAASLIGAVVLAGWVLEIPQLKSLSIASVTMKANTALCMFLSGGALAFLAGPRISPRRIFAAMVLTGIVLTIALATLFQYLFGWSLHLDELIVPDYVASVLTSTPGRMSPTTAVCFLFMAVGLIATCLPDRWLWRHPLSSSQGAVAALLGALTVGSFIVSESLGYRLLSYTGMALITGICFILLGPGLILVVRSRGGCQWSLDWTTTTLFACGILAFVVMTAVSDNLTSRLQGSLDAVDRSQEIRNHIRGVDSGMAQLESMQRGYILTGDESLLRNWRQAKTAIQSDVNHLKSLMVDADQMKLLTNLEPLIRQSTEFIEATIDLRRARGLAASAQLVATGTGIRLSQEIAQVVAALLSRENALLAHHRQKSGRAITLNQLLLPLGVCISLVMLFLAVLFHNSAALAQTQAEVKFMASQERLRLAAAAANIGLWDWNLETNDVYYSPEWKKQLGYDDHELPSVFGEWRKRLHPDDFERCLHELSTFLAVPHGKHESEFRLRHKDGSYRWIYLLSDAMRNEAGSPIRMLGCHLDISDRKQSEERQRQGQKMEAIGYFAGGIAHDFNNLLMIISSYGELVKGALPGEKEKRYAEELLTASSRGAALVRQLMAFSQKNVQVRSEIEVNGVIKGLREMIARLAGKKISFQVICSSTPCHVGIDQGQLEQILLNLAANGCDAMPKGGLLTLEVIPLTLKQEFTEHEVSIAAGSYALIAVSDSGTGIPPELRAKIFDSFFTTKAAGKGTGIGLATVSSLVKNAGGKIVVVSELGLGTSFKIYLPLLASPAAQAPPEVEAPRGSEHVLLVDDEATLRIAIGQYLRSLGYEVTEARSGMEALAQLSAAHKFDVLVTDVMMPGMTGTELASAIYKQIPGLPVLFMSGYTDGALQHSKRIDADSTFLQKPFSLDDLAGRLRSVLAKEPPPQSQSGNANV